MRKEVIVIGSEEAIDSVGNTFTAPIELILKSNSFPYRTIQLPVLAEWLKLHSRTIIEEKVPVIISGSFVDLHSREKWKINLESFVHDAIEAESPLLGICFGAQLIFKSLYPGDIILNSAAEIGDVYPAVERARDGFFGIRDGHSYYSFHFDGMALDAHQSKVIECIAKCSIGDKEIYEAFCLKGKPIYGVQFHPEFNHEQFVQLVATNEEKLWKQHSLDATKILENLEIHESRAEMIVAFVREYLRS